MVMLLLLSKASFSDCIINCTAFYKVLEYDGTHLQTIQGGGSLPELAIVTQGQGYYWHESERYRLDIHFYSGYELNKGTGQQMFNDNAIIAVVAWSDGGYSTIVLSNVITHLKYERVDDILYDDNTGLRNYSYEGKDLDGRIWHISLD